MSDFKARFTVLIFLAACLTPTAMAQGGECFPTCDITDSRMLSLGGAGLQTNAGFELLLKLEVPAGKKNFRLGIFDGDTGKENFSVVEPNDGSFGHWDQGPSSEFDEVQLTYELWADRQGNGLGFLDSSNLVAEWTGNDPNSWEESDCIVDGVFYSFCPSMPDNAWWNATVKTEDRAKSNDGRFVYLLRVVNPSPSAVFSSNFKLRIASGSISVRQGRRLDANNPSLVLETAWGIQAAVRGLLGAGGIFPSARVVYPGWDGALPSTPDPLFLNLETTYNGDWEFPFNVNAGQDTIRILDGDFDFGTKGLDIIFSGGRLDPCFDDDDPNYEGKPDFAGQLTHDEGAVVLGGEPADDTNLDPFLRRPCVVYELEDPLGNVYLNANPSSEQEWENFVVTAKPLVPAEHDFGGAANDPNQPPGFLPAGKWILRIRGLDLGNTVFLNGPNISGQPGASIGDRVWLDNDGDKIQDLEEPGINGVLIRLYRDNGDGIFNPGLDMLVDTTTTAGDGDYLFSPLQAGDYFVDVDETTLPPGLSLTTANEPYRPNGPYPLMANEDHLEADFGYRMPCAGSTCVQSKFNGTAIPSGRTIWFNSVAKFRNIPSNQPVEILVTSAIVNNTCDGGAAGGTFACDKPIDSLTMIWDGTQDIRVNAWKGAVGGSVLLASQVVLKGAAITVSGYAGSPNDVFWEIFDAATNVKLGESTFHLSCSDDDMDGPEDCGKREGDGKGKTGFINDWLLEGMVDAKTTLSCSGSPTAPPPSTGFFHERLPNALIRFSPSAPQASTIFNVTENRWETTIPSSLRDKNVFLTGLALPVTMNLPGGIDPVSWKAVVAVDTVGVEVEWKWAAAVYTNLGDHSTLGVKPVDGDKQNPYPNSDHAGTPENFKNFVTGGARGGGGSNYTGSYSGTGKLKPCEYNPPPPTTPGGPQCAVCKGGTTSLVMEYQGPAANLVVYDDSSVKADKVLFSGNVASSQKITLNKRPGQDKFNNDISFYINGQFHAKLHTSCSKPIGPGMRVGNLEILSGVSKDNGPMCPLTICDAAASGVDYDKEKAIVRVTNNGDVNIAIESISLNWPMSFGRLIEVKRGGDTIHKGVFFPGSAIIISGWEGNLDKRTIEPGKTEDLTFKFENNTNLSGDFNLTVDFDQGCSVTADLKAPFSGGSFACDKPINTLTMIWQGSPATVSVKAWKGSVGSTLLGTKSVSVGNEIVFTGFAGSPNDVFWEIFDGTMKLGESVFHLSCSDSDMNGPEDCGKLQGDGKGQSGKINAWKLEGMVDAKTSLNCTAP